jgi:hypothetical protein
MSASQIRRMPLPASASLSESRPRPSVLSDEHTACRREIQRLLIENAQLAGDLSDARARYDDLKRSAEFWADLYERQLRRKGESS